MTAGPVLGALDLPVAGTTTSGPVVVVEGWVLFDGQPADRVDVHVAGRGVQRARVLQPRADLGSGFPQWPSAGLAGFTALVTAAPEDGPADLVLRAVATAPGGSTWVSEGRTVSVTPPPRDTDLRRPRRRELPVPPSTRQPGRLVVLTHSLTVGGGQLWLQELVERLVRDHAWEVLVVSQVDGVLRSELEEIGVAVRVVGPPRLGTTTEFDDDADSLALLASAWGATAGLINTLGYFTAVEACRRAGVPAAWAVHESFTPEHFTHLNWGTPGLTGPLREVFADLLRSVDPAVFVADSTRDLFRDLVRPGAARTVRYGTPLHVRGGTVHPAERAAARAQLGIDPRRTVLLSVGIVEPRKGSAALVVAHQRLAQVHDDVDLVILGGHESPYCLAVEELVERAGLADRVRVVPIQRDPLPWFLTADVYVNCSDVESLPRSILEAICCGLPVVATDVFGARELIEDGTSGWLVTPNDTGALTAGLARALATPPRVRAELARAAWDRSAYFLDPSTYAAELDDLLRELSLREAP